METNFGLIYWLLCEGITFITFLMMCTMLLPRRFNIKATLLIMGGFLLGVISVNTALLFTGLPAVQIIGLFLLTAYIPMIICFHILSKASIVQTAVIWSIGFIGYYILKFADKFTMSYLIMKTVHRDAYKDGIISLIIIISIAITIQVILARYIQKPLKKYILELKTNWVILLLPLFLMLVLFSYSCWSTINTTISALLFFVVFSMFILLSKALKSTYEASCLRKNENNLAMRIEMQKHNYETIFKKVESTRAYRHDMRHHLITLDVLLQQGENKEALNYIQNLSDELCKIETKAYCENLTVNAILSFYIGSAKAVDCIMYVNVEIPKELVFEDMDLCVIFSNALENAIKACEKIPDKSKRIITVSSSYKDGKLAISVENTCFDILNFDEVGFPIVPKREEHGIGLKSIEAVVKEYHGFFACSLYENVFSVKAVIFEYQKSQPTIQNSQPPIKVQKTKTNKSSFIVCFLILSCCVLLATTPATAMSMEENSVFGNIFQVLVQKTDRFNWGDSNIYADLPQIELNQQPKIPEDIVITASSAVPEVAEIFSKKLSKDYEKNTSSNTDAFVIIDENRVPKVVVDTPKTTIPPNSSNSKDKPEEPIDSDLSDGIEDMNKQMEQYVKQLKQEFIRYISMKYQGYVGMDTTYMVLSNNEDIISIRFNTTVNLGGSGEISRIFTLDKQTAKVINIEKLFIENSDYIKIISKEIISQMEEQVKNENSDYFILGGIWPDSECFNEIRFDQNFYINNQRKLTIVFDEYVVAPGFMGCPEFIIPTEIIKTILIKLSLIQ